MAFMVPETTSRGGRRPVRIGKYEVRDHIATGGMGTVYRAVDVELGRTVALKVLSPDLVSAKPVVLERFRREAKSAAMLRHDNIVAIYDIGEDNGIYFLAFEFIDGIDLHKYIDRQGTLDPEEARQILIQAARALDHAHKQDIVHRDIKPSNFLITTKNDKLQVKLTDMGLARVIRDDEFRLTMPGATVGTLDYMSPEQARDSNSADIRSDIYSLGCTFYHMLAGHGPFAEGTLAERLYQHAEAEPPDIRGLNPSVPKGLAVVLAKMLEKKPADRYQTPFDLLRDLENPEKLRAPVTKSEVLYRLAEEEEPVAYRLASGRNLLAAGDEGRKTLPLRASSTEDASVKVRRLRDGPDEPALEPVTPWWLLTWHWLAGRLTPVLKRYGTSHFLRDNWLWLTGGVALILALVFVFIQFWSRK